MEHPGQEKEESGIQKGEDEEQKQEMDDDDREIFKGGENPLEKYMKMVLETREKQHVQVSCIHICMKSPVKLCFFMISFVAAALCIKPSFFVVFQNSSREGHSSPEAKSLSEDKDNR